MLQRAVTPAYGKDVPVTSIRVGSVPGTHELVGDATYEQITLTHLARDRRVFAEGAVSAARWLAGKNGTSGVFTIADMLGATES
jgi:4-hydroxy-tetrahydrodipicolinate reductase